MVSVAWCPWLAVAWCPWLGVRGLVWLGVRGLMWLGVRGVVSVLSAVAGARCVVAVFAVHCRLTGRCGLCDSRLCTLTCRLHPPPHLACWCSALPCPRLPRLASSVLACPCLLAHTAPGLVLPVLACLHIPHLALSCLSLPACTYRTWPCLVCIWPTCLHIPHLALSCLSLLCT